MSKTGVQEWAKHSINLQYTCEYNCKYCYAKKMDKRFNFKVKEPIIKKYNGVIMFPTMHDITLSNFDKVSDTIEKLLKFDNKILIVSKMNSALAYKFCDRFKYHGKRNNLEFRICLTHTEEARYSFNKIGLYYWEPQAPSCSDRTIALEILKAFFKCSISIEPLLDLKILKCFTKYRTSSLNVWIGCLTNYKLNPKIRAEELVIELYKNLPEIYEEYRKYDFIKFKDSFFKAMEKEIKRRKIGGSK